MEHETLQKTYEEIRKFFIERCEVEGIAITPTLGLSRTLSLTGCLYHEVYERRIYQVSIDPHLPYVEEESFDYWTSTFKVNGANHLSLYIDSHGITHDFTLLWAIRNKWLRDQISEDELADFLGDKVTRTRP